jgi:hypothetical protein
MLLSQVRSTKGDTPHAKAAWRTEVTSSDGLTSCTLAEVHRSGGWISYLPKPGTRLVCNGNRTAWLVAEITNWTGVPTPPRCHTQAPSRASGLRQQRRGRQTMGTTPTSTSRISAAVAPALSAASAWAPWDGTVHRP